MGACRPFLVGPDGAERGETAVAQKLNRRGKLYVFLRTIRSELFDEAFQDRFAPAYRPRGTRPIPPTLLAMVLLLQAYEQVGDAEAVENATGDLRWQLVLGCQGPIARRYPRGR